MKQKVLLIPSRSKKWQGINRLSNFGFQSSSNLNTNNYKYLATLVYYNYSLPHVILTSNSQIRKVPNLENPSYDFKNTVCFCILKGQTKSKWFFQAEVSSKKRTNEFYFTTMIPQVDLFSFVFWKKLKTPKRQFEINWPLITSRSWNKF